MVHLSIVIGYYMVGYYKEIHFYLVLYGTKKTLCNVH